MELTSKQLKFYTVMLVGVLLVAILVLGIDFAIKGAILEESNRLRMTINGQKPDQNGTVSNAADDSTVPGDVLAVFPPRVASGTTANGHKSAAPPEPNARFANPNGPGDNTGISPEVE